MGVAITTLAALAYAVPALGASRLSAKGARIALGVAWLLHAAALGWGLLGDNPRFGWAPALSATGWLVLTVYVIEQELFPQLHARWGLATLECCMAVLESGETHKEVELKYQIPVHDDYDADFVLPS